MVQETNSLNSSELKSQVEYSLNTLVELSKGAQKRRVLIDNGESIFLQVVIFKIPELDEIVKRRISLKHPVWAGVPDVCLIVRDFIMRDRVKRTSDEMIDITVEKYQDLLEKHRVTGITNVMPYRQLKTEYDTYELRKKLINRFDIFLCDSYLHSRGHFFDCLGKIFIEKNKYPIAVKLPKLKSDFDPMVNTRIASAIASTVFYIKPSSDNYSIRIGNTLNEKEGIVENLNIVIDKILNSDDLIPGGIKNVRSLHVKTEKSKAVPIYISLQSGNDIPVPLVKPNVPVAESVEDELSTFPGKKVTVLPSGDVFVTDIERKDSRDNNSEEEEYEEEDQDQLMGEGQEEQREIEIIKIKVEKEEVKEEKVQKVEKRGKGAKEEKREKAVRGMKRARPVKMAKAVEERKGVKRTKIMKTVTAAKGAKAVKEARGVKVAKGVKALKGARGENAAKAVKAVKKTVQAVKGAKGVKAVKGGKAVKGVKAVKPVKGVKAVRAVKTLKGAKAVKGVKAVKPVKGVKAVRAVKALKGAKAVKVVKGTKAGYKSKERACKTSKKKTENLRLKKESSKNKKRTFARNEETVDFDVDDPMEPAEQKYLLQKLYQMVEDRVRKELNQKRGMKRKLKDDPKPPSNPKQAKLIKRKTRQKPQNIKKTKRAK